MVMQRCLKFLIGAGLVADFITLLLHMALSIPNSANLAETGLIAAPFIILVGFMKIAMLKWYRLRWVRIASCLITLSAGMILTLPFEVSMAEEVRKMIEPGGGDFLPSYYMVVCHLLFPGLMSGGAPELTYGYAFMWGMAQYGVVLAEFCSAEKARG